MRIRQQERERTGTRRLLARLAVGAAATMLATGAWLPGASAGTVGHQGITQAPARVATVTSMTFFWSTLYRGDCEMQNATLVIRSDGTADFSATTLTHHTHTHDVWWSTLYLQSSGGTTLWTSPTFRSPDMSDGNPPPTYHMAGQFIFDPTIYSSINEASMQSSC
jgi:uncharacterized protein DUF6294